MRTNRKDESNKGKERIGVDILASQKLGRLRFDKVKKRNK
jgi:hypothetical protein